MDPIESRSRANAAATIPGGGTKKSTQSEDATTSFASLLAQGGLGGNTNGSLDAGGGLEDTLGGALDRETSPERDTYEHDRPEEQVSELDSTRNDDHYDAPPARTDDSHNGYDDDVMTNEFNEQSAPANADNGGENLENSPDNNASTQDEGPTDEARPQQAATSEDNETPTEDGATKTDVATVTNDATSGNAAVDQSGKVLSNIMATAETAGIPVQAAAVASKANGGETKGKNNSLDGINKAIAATSKDPSTTAKDGQANAAVTPQGETDAGKARGKGKNIATNKAAAQTQTASATTSKAAEQAQAQTANKVEQPDAGKSNAAKQAAELSRAIGPDTKVSVNVSSQSESETLVSRPRSSLTLTPTDGSKGSKGNNAAATGTQTSTTQQSATNNAQNMASQQQASAQNAMVAQGQAQAANRAEVAASGNSSTSTISQPAAAEGGSLNSSATLGEGQQTKPAAPMSKPAVAAQTANARQPVAEQISVHITKAISSGMDKISIQLRPASLGRIDVQLEMTGDGRISAVVTVDNKDTLNLLQRDSRELQQALQNAGLQAETGDLSFNLRGEGGTGDPEADNNANGKAVAEDKIKEEPLEDLLAAKFNQQDKGGADGRIDIHA